MLCPAPQGVRAHTPRSRDFASPHCPRTPFAPPPTIRTSLFSLPPFSVIPCTVQTKKPCERPRQSCHSWPLPVAAGHQRVSRVARRLSLNLPSPSLRCSILASELSLHHKPVSTPHSPRRNIQRTTNSHCEFTMFEVSEQPREDHQKLKYAFNTPPDEPIARLAIPVGPTYQQDPKSYHRPSPAASGQCRPVPAASGHRRPPSLPSSGRVTMGRPGPTSGRTRPDTCRPRLMWPAGPANL